MIEDFENHTSSRSCMLNRTYKGSIHLNKSENSTRLLHEAVQSLAVSCPFCTIKSIKYVYQMEIFINF